MQRIVEHFLLFSVNTFMEMQIHDARVMTVSHASELNPFENL